MTSRFLRAVAASIPAAVAILFSGSAAAVVPEPDGSGGYVGLPTDPDDWTSYVGLPNDPEDPGAYVGLPTDANPLGSYVGLPAGSQGSTSTGVAALEETPSAASPISSSDLAGLGGLAAAGVGAAVIRRRLLVRRDGR